jgi:diamine N-acetyltransferase
MLEAREVTYETVGPLLRLKVSPRQENFVASNAKTIAQAAYEPFSWLRGLWLGDTPVGLIAMIDMLPEHPEVVPEDPPNAIFLWRLMIATDQQRKGFGREAMQIAFAEARARGRETFCTSVVPEADGPMPFYVKCGLEPTDRFDDGERVLQGPVPPA